MRGCCMQQRYGMVQPPRSVGPPDEPRTRSRVHGEAPPFLSSAPPLCSSPLSSLFPLSPLFTPLCLSHATRPHLAAGGSVPPPPRRPCTGGSRRGAQSGSSPRGAPTIARSCCRSRRGSASWPWGRWPVSLLPFAPGCFVFMRSRDARRVEARKGATSRSGRRRGDGVGAVGGGGGEGLLGGLPTPITSPT